MNNDSSYFSFELKEQQKQVFASLLSFVNDANSKIFILRGYAGTGKTSLMSGFVKKLQDLNRPHVLLASTGRAAKVLSDKTQRSASTIHSLIYDFNELSEDLEKLANLQDNLSVDETGQIRLLFDLTPIVSEVETIYIIDEASMISDKEDKLSSFAKFGSGRLLNDLLKYDRNGKFIFVGDPCQLPPINQSFSPALEQQYLQEVYGVSTFKVELTESIRHNVNNGIYEASLHIRKMYKNNSAEKYPRLRLKGYENVKLHDSDANLINDYLDRVRKKGYEYSTLICHTNKLCSGINNLARKALYNNPPSLVKGDLLMITQNNYLVDLVNGDFVVVEEIGQKECRAGLTFIRVKVRELASKQLYSSLIIEEVLSSFASNIDSVQHRNLLIDFYLRMRSLDIKQKSDEFRTKMMEDPYLNALRAVYGYAITCHKSQGGEWEEVYLCLNNKMYGIKKPGLYQWWYTAITRAKQNLHTINDWFIQ